MTHTEHKTRFTLVEALERVPFRFGGWRGGKAHTVVPTYWLLVATKRKIIPTQFQYCILPSSLPGKSKPGKLNASLTGCNEACSPV